jgi:hypothetical protein
MQAVLLARARRTSSWVGTYVGSVMRWMEEKKLERASISEGDKTNGSPVEIQ